MLIDSFKSKEAKKLIFSNFKIRLKLQKRLLTFYKTTPCGPAPPSTQKPAMAYTKSENWQKYDVIVLLCKQDCTPSRDYISFIFGLRQHSLLNLQLIKISINFLCLLLLVWG